MNPSGWHCSSAFHPYILQLVTQRGGSWSRLGWQDARLADLERSSVVCLPCLWSPHPCKLPCLHFPPWNNHSCVSAWLLEQTWVPQRMQPPCRQLYWRYRAWNSRSCELLPRASQEQQRSMPVRPYPYRRPCLRYLPWCNHSSERSLERP